MKAMICQVSFCHNWRFVVSLIRYSFRFSIVLLLSSPFLVGQATEKKLDDAFAEISFLKRVVAEQDRRISELEKAVGALDRMAKPEIPADGRQVGVPAPTNWAMGWKTPAAWGRMKDGMSRAQVEAILGRPTSAESLYGYWTLFYSGQVAGAGSVTGTVKLHDDRVWEVNVPVF
jgi:hypothetical protein